MNKTKLLIISVVILFVLNIGIIGYLSFSKEKNHDERRTLREIVIKKLQFDQKQISEYEKTIRFHRETIQKLDDSLRTSKIELYQLLNSENINNIQKENLYLKIANYQKQIEPTHFNHFLAIKAICRKEQLSDYNKLTKELAQMFSIQRPPKPN